MHFVLFTTNLSEKGFHTNFKFLSRFVVFPSVSNKLYTLYTHTESARKSANKNEQKSDGRIRKRDKVCKTERETSYILKYLQIWIFSWATLFDSIVSVYTNMLHIHTEVNTRNSCYSTCFVVSKHSDVVVLFFSCLFFHYRFLLWLGYLCSKKTHKENKKTFWFRKAFEWWIFEHIENKIKDSN